MGCVEDCFIFPLPLILHRHFSVLIQAVTEPLICPCFYPEPPQVVLQSLCPINPTVIYVIRTVTLLLPDSCMTTNHLAVFRSFELNF